MSQEFIVILEPGHLKILHVKIYVKSKCRADANIVQNKEYLYSGVPGVPGVPFQSACVLTLVTLLIFVSYMVQRLLI